MSTRREDLPVACTLTPGELASQRDDLLPGLLRRATARRKIVGGFAYAFAPADDLLRLVVDTIGRERRCCQFLRFQLTIEPALGPIRLDITGPSGTRDFLTDLQLSADRE